MHDDRHPPGESEYDMDFEVTDVQQLPSLSELASQAMAPSLSDDDAAKLMIELIRDNQVPLPPTMGAEDYVSRILRLLKGRQKIKDLPAVEIWTPWLRLHVPKGASVTLAREMVQHSAEGLQMLVFGSGYGSQKLLKLSSKEISAAREQCANYELNFTVQPTLYSINGRSSLETNILSFNGQRSMPRKPCLTCNANIAALGSGKYRSEPYIDLSQDSAALTITREYQISSSHTTDLGVKIFLGEPYRYPWGIGALLLDQDGSPLLLQQKLEER